MSCERYSARPSWKPSRSPAKTFSATGASCGSEVVKGRRLDESVICSLTLYDTEWAIDVCFSAPAGREGAARVQRSIGVVPRRQPSLITCGKEENFQKICHKGFLIASTHTIAVISGALPDPSPRRRRHIAGRCVPARDFPYAECRDPGPDQAQSPLRICRKSQSFAHLL